MKAHRKGFQVAWDQRRLLSYCMDRETNDRHWAVESIVELRVSWALQNLRL